MSIDELLFYGGIVLSALSCLSILLSVLVSKIEETKLDAQLIKEYGEQEPRRKGDRDV